MKRRGRPFESPPFHRRPTAKGVGLCLADSHTSNHPEDGFTPLKTIRRLLVVIGRRSHSSFEREAFEPERRVRHQALQSNVMSFMLEGVDGEFSFLPAEGVSEGRNSPSAKFVNNDAPMIDATPLSSIHPSNIVENVVDSDDPSYGEDVQTLVGPSLPPHPEASKKLKILGKRKVASGVPGKALPLKVQKVHAQASKVAGEASTPLDVNSDSDIHAKELRDATDCHWVVAHVTLPSWKQHLREISIEQLCDIHDRAYMRHAVLDNMLNNLNKDRAYAKLEMKCNEALQDLDKNPLVFDMRAEIKALQGQVDGLHSIKSERERLESSKIQLLQEINNLKQDRADVVSKVIPDAAMKLVCGDDLVCL
ncbi:hypothetical protein Tco_0204417 [Tanacetum coccineum]